MSPIAVTLIVPDTAPVLSKEFLDIQAAIECGFTLKCVHDMIRTYSQLKPTKLENIMFSYGMVQIQ